MEDTSTPENFTKDLEQDISGNMGRVLDSRLILGVISRTASFSVLTNVGLVQTFEHTCDLPCPCIQLCFPLQYWF
jgi:hypothetical protein